ncbi:MAG: DUF2206 domain-containing protein [Candidatus Odinarchaeota archaeon]|nr:DUF2206 domain-containing protein [Candidatus Odinarchaeota archaeon]
MDKSSIAIDFGTKNLLKIVLMFQLAVLGVIGLDFIGLKIPILREAICFIYLTFIPGILLLRILKLYELDIIESILYSVGISLAFLMLIGSLMNSFYPLLGITKPISEIPLLITISVIVFLLCFICYLRDKDYSTSFSINIKQILSPPVLSLLLLPFLAILGACLFNFYDTNILLLILLGIISLIPIFIVVHRCSLNIYPLIIWVVSISLLFHTSLVTMFISNHGDADMLYLFASVVKTSNFWDVTIASPTNSLLSVTMFLPIFSKMTDLDLIWVMKIIYPAVFSLVPVGLFHIYNKQFSKRASLLSCFLFMFTFTFYTNMPLNVKTGLAIFFIVVFVMLAMNKEINPLKKKALLIVFILSVIVSHYGTSYLFLLSIIFVSFLTQLMPIYNSHPRRERNTITPIFVVLSTVLAFSWYIYTSSSTGFSLIVGFLNNFINSLFVEAFTMEQLALSTELPISIVIARYLYFIIYFFISIGIFKSTYDIISRKEGNDFNREFMAFSIFFYGVVLTAFLPTRTFSMVRVSFICLMFIAPFCAIGIKYVFDILLRSYSSERSALIFFSAILTILLLFSSGVVSEGILKGDDFSFNKLIVNEARAGNIENPHFIYEYSRIYNQQDIISAKWLLAKFDVKEREHRVYVDLFGGNIFSICSNTTHRKKLSCFDLRRAPILPGSYIYLRYYANIRGLTVVRGEQGLVMKNIGEILTYGRVPVKNKIYTNGDCVILYVD